MLQITETVGIDESEIEEEFVRASGPGGQNVNKVATAVQLRFDVTGSPSLPDDVRERLIRLAGKRVTRDGVLVIQAQRFRTQEQNRRDALERLIELVRAAAVKPRNRHRTKPTKASKERRLEAKRHRSLLKTQRKPSPD
ncbi:MAG: alternative ribosome rescue aminoacyl-tRNA hydrolase ArfB [Syntrophobacteraceae bacterium]